MSWDNLLILNPQRHIHKRCGQGSLRKIRPMNKQIIDVETICLMNEDITIACGLLNKKESDGKPTYTNIFCSREELIDILLEEKSAHCC